MRITMSIAYFELVCVQNYLEARQVRLISYFSLSLESLIFICNMTNLLILFTSFLYTNKSKIKTKNKFAHAVRMRTNERK